MKEFIVDLVPYYELERYLNEWSEKGYGLRDYSYFDNDKYLVVLRYFGTDD